MQIASWFRGKLKKADMGVLDSKHVRLEPVYPVDLSWASDLPVVNLCSEARLLL